MEYSCFGASLTLLTLLVLSSSQMHNIIGQTYKLQFRMTETFLTLNQNRKRKKALSMDVAGVMRLVYYKYHPVFALLLI